MYAGARNRSTFAMLAAFAVLASPALAVAAPDGPPPLRKLSWPGKVETPAPRKPAARPTAPSQRLSTPTPATPAQPAPAAIAAAAPQIPVPAAAPLQTAQAQAASRPDRPRIYSLHREYGEQPDRTELPPAFFLDSAPVDLAEPPAQPMRDRDERRAASAAADPDRSPN